MTARRFALVAILALAAGTARADQGVPTGRFGVTTALRQNIGELGDSYNVGFLLGLEAGYMPGSSQTWSLGFNWAVLFKGWYFAGDDSLPESRIDATEMSFGARVRRALSDTTPWYLLGCGGVTLLRTSSPLPPDDERSHIGPYAGLGLELFVLGRGFLGFEARYGMLVGGPRSVTFLFSFTGGGEAD